MIYITGDTHGEFDRFENRKLRKLKADDCLIICGDFGFIWNDSKKEQELLHKIGNKKFKTLFVDGTHENYDLLSSYPVTELYGGRVQQINKNIYHLLRGEIYTIESKTFFVFGGGYSDDKEIRQENGTWWQEEQPTENEKIYAKSNLDKYHCSVDYIITHQPSMNDMGMVLRHCTINALSAFFDEISNSVDYKKWYFGSLHKNKKLRKAQCLFTDIVKIN